MKTEQLFQPFEIVIKQTDKCPVEQHRHTFFELIYVVEGTGLHCIKDNNFRYKPQNLFLIRPDVPHHFKVESLSTFLLIRFNSIYLNGQKVKDKHGILGSWVSKMEYIFQSNFDHLGCMLRNVNDKMLVRTLADSIARELQQQGPLYNELIQQLINTLITIVARNISQLESEGRVEDSLSQNMISYIHQNIYNQEKLKVEILASHFNLSPNYVSEYFKKHIGQNLQHYIMMYRLKLAETRLQYSVMRVNEIAFELGFSDESHLTKMFRKYRGITPTAFRKTKAAVKAAA